MSNYSSTSESEYYPVRSVKTHMSQRREVYSYIRHNVSKLLVVVVLLIKKTEGVEMSLNLNSMVGDMNAFRNPLDRVR